jgi:thiamine biosynthesis lipoprotein
VEKGRLNMKKYFAIVCLLCTILLQPNTSLHATEPSIFLQREMEYMSTQILVTLYQGEEADLDAIENIYRTYGHLADNFKAPDLTNDNPLYHENNIVTINQNRGISPVVVDQRLYDLVKLSIAHYNQSNGFFNPAIGNAIDIWKSAIYSEYMFDELPESVFNQIQTDLQNISDSVNPSSIVFNDNDRSVFINNNNLKLDLGAIAKGYATQKTKEYLVSKNITKYMINAGRSNIIVGVHPDDSEANDRPFRVVLEDPPRLYQNGISGILEVRNKAVVTSGNYEQFVTYQGKVYHHIISPFDFAPKQYHHVVTIIGDDSALLDSMSTALFSMPLDQATTVVQNLGIEAIFYMYDGSIETVNLTQNFRQSALIANEPNDLTNLYLILGGVVIVGGALIIGISVYDKKKKAKGDVREDKNEA